MRVNPVGDILGGVAALALAALFFWLKSGSDFQFMEIAAWLSLLSGLALLFQAFYPVIKHTREVSAHEVAMLEASKRQHVADQRLCGQDIDCLVEQVLSSIESMPEDLIAAERFLDQAEIDFRERAFSPFWDSIESAAKSIGQYGEHIRSLESDLTSYQKLVSKYEGHPPRFPIAREAIPALREAANTSMRLQRVARLAQRDFQFVAIYEQQRTNRILVEGFGTLARAISDMTSSLETSIGGLEDSLNRVNESINRVGVDVVRSLDAIDTELSDIHSDLAQAELHRVERQKEALVRLGQIRRRL